MILNKFLTASLLAFAISTGANVTAHANTIFNTSNYIPCTSLAKSQSYLGTNTVSGFTDTQTDHYMYESTANSQFDSKLPGNANNKVHKVTQPKYFLNATTSTYDSNDHQEYVKINGQGWINSKSLKYQPAIYLTSQSKADGLSGYFSVVEQNQQPAMTYYVSNSHLASLFSLAAKLWKPTGVKITRTQNKSTANLVISLKSNQQMYQNTPGIYDWGDTCSHRTSVNKAILKQPLSIQKRMAVHEFGHALGLEHISISNSVMSAKTPATHYRPSATDYQHVKMMKSIYPYQPQNVFTQDSTSSLTLEQCDQQLENVQE